MGCIAVGSMFSLAVFLDPITRDTGWSRATVSSAMTVDFVVMGFAGFFWGSISDRIGPRPVALVGAVLLGIGLWIGAHATTPLGFQLGFGVFVGIAAGAFFAPLIAAVTSWFDTHRALAVSLVSVGVGVAPLTVSPFAAWLITHQSWRASMATIAVVAWALLIPAALFVRRRPRSGHGAPPIDAEAPQFTAAQALGTPQFATLALTFFLCCAAHSGPIFHTVSYAQLCGLSVAAAVSVYSAEGLAGLFGRLFCGAAADRFGTKRVLITGLLTQAVAISLYPAISTLGPFYAVAALFGLAYGGVMPLYAVLARETFGQRIMGTVFGAATLASSLGMALGPLGGGWIFDRTQGYGGMYLAAAAIGLAAAAMALGFPSRRSDDASNVPMPAQS
ncbi:MAG: MFS transporter [Steroidobacteraceae bacterium]